MFGRSSFSSFAISALETKAGLDLRATGVGFATLPKALAQAIAASGVGLAFIGVKTVIRQAFSAAGTGAASFLLGPGKVIAAAGVGAFETMTNTVRELFHSLIALMTITRTPKASLTIAAAPFATLTVTGSDR
jgi:alpha-D-ribose 1-methylphosphonate 5-phosphate C-P lyase